MIELTKKKEEIIDEEEVLSDVQELFIALLKGDDKDIKDKLYRYVYGIEYCWVTQGGEPDLKEVLAIKLLEKMIGRKYDVSMIYSEDYLNHIFKEERRKKND